VPVAHHQPLPVLVDLIDQARRVSVDLRLLAQALEHVIEELLTPAFHDTGR
jgi:hypothetical protein